MLFNDYIGQHLATVRGLGLLLVCLAVQLSRKRNVPGVCWFAVTAVSIFGTMSADLLNKDLGMPLWGSTAALLVLQAGVVTAWYKTQGSLDMHSIANRMRERSTG